MNKRSEKYEKKLEDLFNTYLKEMREQQAELLKDLQRRLHNSTEEIIFSFYIKAKQVAEEQLNEKQNRA